MKPCHRSPSYIIRNPHGYCFRMIVPKDLRKFVGKTELRYTLKTGYLGVAKHKARLIAGQVQLIFRYLRKGDRVLSKLSDGQIRKLVHQYIKDSIESWDREFYEEGDGDVPGFRPYAAIEFFDDIRNQLIDCLNNSDFSMLEKPTAELLKKNGISDIN